MKDKWTRGSGPGGSGARRPSPARIALEKGDLIAAYDAASSAIAGGDSSLGPRYAQVLALARMGDTARAMELFERYGLDRSPDPHQQALGARLLKDSALAAPPGPERHAGLCKACGAYADIFETSGDPFPGINAATLASLCGETERGRRIAASVLDALGKGPDDFFAVLTRVEALLVLGRSEMALRELERPEVAAGDHGARSTALRQLSILADHLDLEGASRARLQAVLAPPAVAHFTGHMFAADPQAEGRLSTEIRELLIRERVGFLYGALACGADILFAEAALEAGIELNVVLPFPEEDFLRHSVAPGGRSWLIRYQACRDAAASFREAGRAHYVGGAEQIAYGSAMAMGLARLRAGHLSARPVQLAVWDGISAGAAGTGADVALWRAKGGEARAIDPGPVNRALSLPEPAGPLPERRLVAILFADVAGFSALEEAALPAFWSHVMGRIAAVLDDFGDAVECRNSWGDALYAVTSNVDSAAAIALDLQRLFEDMEGEPDDGCATRGVRIGVHYGPAYRTVDPITDRGTYYGTEVSRAARIEPVAPPGSVFVTEPFAAMLALEGSKGFSCRYVGRIPLAKGYGEYPTYRLESRIHQMEDAQAPASG